MFLTSEFINGEISCYLLKERTEDRKKVFQLAAGRFLSKPELPVKQ